MQMSYTKHIENKYIGNGQYTKTCKLCNKLVSDWHKHLNIHEFSDKYDDIKKGFIINDSALVCIKCSIEVEMVSAHSHYYEHLCDGVNQHQISRTLHECKMIKMCQTCHIRIHKCDIDKHLMLHKIYDSSETVKKYYTIGVNKFECIRCSCATNINAVYWHMIFHDECPIQCVVIYRAELACPSYALHEREIWLPYYKCLICDDITTSPNHNLFRHGYQPHHSSRIRYECDSCGNKSLTIDQIMEQVHNPPEIPNGCHIVASRGGLWRDGKYVDCDCGYRIGSVYCIGHNPKRFASQFAKHLSVHHRVIEGFQMKKCEYSRCEKQECIQCGFELPSASHKDFKIHLKHHKNGIKCTSHCGDYRFTCEQCGKQFHEYYFRKNYRPIQEHYRMHRDRKCIDVLIAGCYDKQNGDSPLKYVSKDILETVIKCVIMPKNEK